MVIKWNEETWYSRLATLLFFLLGLTSVSFYVGRQYETTLGYLSAEVQIQENIGTAKLIQVENLKNMQESEN